MSQGYECDCQLCGGEVLGGTYTAGACEKCGAKYEYEEGYRLCDEEIAKLVAEIARLKAEIALRS